jgi:hypothetical protein
MTTTASVNSIASRAASSGVLAKALDLPSGSYDLRSNMAGIAVSGEITLHAERIYVQASQPFGGFDSGILIRTCKGRKDYVGGPNNFASLDLLHEPEKLARVVKQVNGRRPAHEKLRAADDEAPGSRSRSRNSAATSCAAWSRTMPVPTADTC